MTDYIPYEKLKLQSGEFTNPRTQTGLDDADITELADDIARRGLLYPLLVWAQDNIILGGQRRYRAIGKLIEAGSWERFSVPGSCPLVPVIYYEGATLEEAKAAALADGLHRSDISQYEIAEYISLMDGSQEDIAQKIGKSRTFVNKLLKTWRSACPDLKEIWRKGELAYDTVKQIAAEPPAIQMGLVKLHKRAPRGRAKNKHKRPGVAVITMIADKKPKTDYERGLRDMARYAAQGKTPGGRGKEAWSRYVEESDV